MRKYNQNTSKSPPVEKPLGMLGIIRIQFASSAIPPPNPELTFPEGRWLPPPEFSTGRQLISPGKGRRMQLSSRPGSAHSPSRKEPPSPRSLPLDSSSPSAQSHLPMEVRQSSLQLVPGKDLLRSKEPTTRANEVARIGDPERKSGWAIDRRAKNRAAPRETTRGIGSGSAEAEAEDHGAHRRLCTT